MSDDIDRPHRPAVEPEIIPPGRARTFEWPRDRVYATHRIYVSPLGPVGITLIFLALGVLAAILLFALIGAVLIWIPLLAGAVLAGAVVRMLRRR
jgi:hypothetical protein